MQVLPVLNELDVLLVTTYVGEKKAVYTML